MWIDRSDKSDHSFLSVTCRWDYVLLYLFGNLSNVCWAIYIDVWDSELQTQNFSIKLFLPWWKKFTCSEFSQISFGANYFIAHIDWIFFFSIPWNIFYFLKPSLFLKYSQWCCCRCSLARLADGEMSPATWYFYTPGMDVLWWKSGQLWGQLCRDHTQKPRGFHFQQELSRKKKQQKTTLLLHWNNIRGALNAKVNWVVHSVTCQEKRVLQEHGWQAQ